MKLLGLALLCLLGSVAADADPVVVSAASAAAVPILAATAVSTDSEESYILSAAEKMNWYQAEAACAAEGYSLVALDSYATQNEVYLFLVNSGYQSILTEPVWTSGSNLALSSTYSWFKTGEFVKYKNFPKTPSGANRCIALNALSGFWTAEDCNSKRYFICQKRVC